MNYNVEQQEVIDSQESRIAVIAPAGSGKTRCIVGSAEKYFRENPRDHITAITFTRKAAGELKDRCEAILGMEISTIHSWAYRRLVKMGEEYGFKVQLLDDDNIKEILLKLCKLRSRYHINQFQLFSYVMGNYNVDVDDSVKRIFQVLLHDYQKFKAKNHLYDFTDLPSYLYDKLMEYGQRITDIDAFYVDEYQDIDPVQSALFNLVDAKKHVYIMDPNQAIYMFRGSLEDVQERLTNFKFYRLAVNYRSYQEIVDYAVTVRNALEDMVDEDRHHMETLDEFYDTEPCDIVCERGSGGTVSLINSIGSCIHIGEDHKLYSEILTIQNLLSLKNTQILCRSNRQVKKVKSFGIENVSTIHQAKGLEYDNVILASFPVDCTEEMNVAYVGMTRARNNLCVISFDILCYVLAQTDPKQYKYTTSLF